MKVTKIFLALFLSISILFFSCKPKDSTIQQNITEKFAGSQLSGVSATVTDGVATLTGEVKDPAAQTQAETLAKDVKGVKSVVNNVTVAPPPAPVQINTDSTLTQGVTDATKDFPTVTATVNNGEITLTGSIKRSDLPTLMQSLNSLQPKKINNQLTIK
jgi:hyperosmotically inducible periplasmic protein